MTRSRTRAWPAICFAFVLSFCGSVGLAAPRTGELRAGWASTSITPDQPVALSGQVNTRISKRVHDPVTATALAIEVADKAGSIDHAVIISCDVVAIRGGVQVKTREKLSASGKAAGLDVRKLVFCATHTHTGPVLTNLRTPPLGVPDAKPKIKYAIPKEGVVQVDAYIEWMTDRLAEIIVKAWTGRKPAGVSWCVSQAAVGYNRRAVYADGSAKMYGKVNTPHFRRIEGPVDHDVDVLFFWDASGKLTGLAVNVPCPSQAIEGQSYLSADYWHEARNELRKAYGQDLFVLPLCGAAGDISPHPLVRKRSEGAMWKRKGISQTAEIGQRIATAVAHVHDAAKRDVHKQVPFGHVVETVALPTRRVSKAEAERSRARIRELTKKSGGKLNERNRELIRRESHAIALHEHPYEGTYPIEVHVLRLGDVAIATNPFELFTDYGLQMKARSPAEQTLAVQLTSGSGSYVPTERAVAGGGYSAEPAQNKVGPEGGQVLVDRSVALIESLWK